MEKVDLNMVFAKHWDRKNPSNFVKACDESRVLQEEAEKRREKLRVFISADTDTVHKTEKQQFIK